MFSRKMRVLMEFSLFIPCDEGALRIQQKKRFVYQDNVLIERLIFDLGLRCEPPKEVVELLTGALRAQSSRTPIS
jgi:hypothetical protein